MLQSNLYCSCWQRYASILDKTWCTRNINNVANIEAANTNSSDIKDNNCDNDADRYIAIILITSGVRFPRISAAVLPPKIEWHCAHAQYCTSSKCFSKENKKKRRINC